MVVVNGAQILTGYTKMVVVNGILTSYYPQNGSKTGFYYHQNGIAKIHKLEFKAFRGDLMSFSDIIKKRIKPNLTDRNRI